MTDSVLISGGSGGIGSALSRQLGKAGYRPIIGFSANRNAAEIVAGETNGLALHLDLSDPQCVAAALTSLAEGEKNVVGVVLAASPAPAIAPVFRLPEGELADQWTVNVTGVHQLLGGIIKRLMRPRKQGWVVGVLSEAMGLHGTAAKSVGGYIIAKYGLMGLLKVIDAEYSWLDVHTVKPGYTETAMLDVFDERFLAQIRTSQPGGRFATPDEIAQSILLKIRGT